MKMNLFLSNYNYHKIHTTMSCWFLEEGDAKLKDSKTFYSFQLDLAKINPTRELDPDPNFLV